MPVKVQFKTLTQISFSLDLNEDETVTDIKNKIAEQRGSDFSAELQKLIYNGKVLDDDAKVGEINFDANKFVVVMLARKKVAEAPAPAAEPMDSTPAPAEQPAPAPAAAPAPAPAPAAAPAGFTAEQEQSIEAISAMGYPRDQVIAALRAAFWNGDRAVEFLLTGLPADADLGEAGEAAGADQDLDVDDIGGANVAEVFNELPQLNEIRQLVQANPEMLGVLMQQLAASNPELLSLIQNNQQQFIDIMNAPVQGGGAGGAQAGGAQAGGNRPRQHVIHLSPEEAAAIQRIKSMGFQVSERMIVEAYFACDKNEEAAVDYILNNMGDEDE